jgi:hypothetical protein
MSNTLLNAVPASRSRTPRLGGEWDPTLFLDRQIVDVSPWWRILTSSEGDV